MKREDMNENRNQGGGVAQGNEAGGLPGSDTRRRGGGSGRRRGVPGDTGRHAPKPGVLTSEFWGVVMALGTALVACMTSDDQMVKLAALGALTLLGSTLGGVYIWSRTRVKVGGRVARAARSVEDIPA